jgi:hypothetical protein
VLFDDFSLLVAQSRRLTSFRIVDGCGEFIGFVCFVGL